MPGTKLGTGGKFKMRGSTGKDEQINNQSDKVHRLSKDLRGSPIRMGVGIEKARQ